MTWLDVISTEEVKLLYNCSHLLYMLGVEITLQKYRRGTIMDVGILTTNVL